MCVCVRTSRHNCKLHLHINCCGGARTLALKAIGAFHNSGSRTSNLLLLYLSINFT